MKKTYKAIIINSKDILLLGNNETKATTSRVFEWNTRSLRTQNSVNIVTVIKFIVKSFRDFDDFRRITILNNDEMIWLEELSPLFQEIEVSYRWNHDVQFIFQNWCCWGWWHGWKLRTKRETRFVVFVPRVGRGWMECLLFVWVWGGFCIWNLFWFGFARANGVHTCVSMAYIYLLWYFFFKDTKILVVFGQNNNC